MSYIKSSNLWLVSLFIGNVLLTLCLAEQDKISSFLHPSIYSPDFLCKQFGSRTLQMNVLRRSLHNMQVYQIVENGKTQ